MDFINLFNKINVDNSTFKFGQFPEHIGQFPEHIKNI